MTSPLISFVRLAVIVLAASSTAVASPGIGIKPDPKVVAALIDRLGDADASIRNEAFAGLAKLGRSVRNELRIAADDSSAQRRRLAKMLLKQMPRSGPDDPEPLREMLRAYEAVPPDAKAVVALQWFGDADLRPIADEAVARVILEEPDEEVVWMIVAGMGQRDRERLVRGPHIASALLQTAPQWLLIGFGADDPARAREGFRKAIDEARLVPPAAFPALMRAANVVCDELRAAGDGAGELEIRRNIAVLAPPQERGAPLSAVGAYFEARLRLRTLDEFEEDLAAIAVPSDDPSARLVAAVIQSGGAKPRPAPMRMADVPAPVLKVIDSIPPEAQLEALETILRAEETGIIDAVTSRLLSQLGPARRQAPLDLLRLRIYMLRYDVARVSENSTAAVEAMQQIIGRVPEQVSVQLTMQDGSQRAGTVTDLLAQNQILRIQELMLTDDRRALDSAFDTLAMIPIYDSSVAIDAIYLFERHDRLLAADEVYAQYMADAYAHLMLIEREGNDPMRAQAYNNAAWFCARTGRNLRQALDYSRRAVQLQPRQPAYQDTLAEVSFRMGLVEQAVRIEEQVLRQMPGDPFLTKQLARFKAGFKEGDAERALPSESWVE